MVKIKSIFMFVFTVQGQGRFLNFVVIIENKTTPMIINAFIQKLTCLAYIPKYCPPCKFCIVLNTLHFLFYNLSYWGSLPLTIHS